MKKFLILFAFSGLLTSCLNKQQKIDSQNLSEKVIIKVDLKEEYKKRTFPYSNTAMTIQKLDEKDEFPIGYIDKLIVDNERIYILDRSKSKSLFIYSRNGRFINVINYIGNGPGEFTFPQDFNIDKKTGNIIIMDSNSRKFIFYSKEGQYLREWKYDSLGVGFTLDNDNIIIDNGNVPTNDGAYYLRKMDFDGNLISSFFPSELSTLGITFNPRSSLQSNDGKLFFLPAISNCIYMLNGEEPVLAYQVDFGKDWPPQEFFEELKKTHPLKIRQLMFDNNYACFLNYIQTDDVMHVDFNLGKNYSCYYDKKTKKILLLGMEDESVSFPLATYGNEFICAKYMDTGEIRLIFYKVDFNILEE